MPENAITASYQAVLNMSSDDQLAIYKKVWISKEAPDASTKESDRKRKAEIEAVFEPKTANTLLEQVDTSVLFVPEKQQSIVPQMKFYQFLDKRYAEIAKAGGNRAITMTELLGSEGVKLYQAALLQEAKSTALRKAAYLAAVRKIPGPPWKKKLLLWIGGPSASGKTFSTSLILKLIGAANIGDLTDPNGDPNDPNYLVSFDGATERVLFQTRQVVLQIAAKKGYNIVTDIESVSKCKNSLGFSQIDKIKSIIKKSWTKKKDSKLHVAIPNTFVRASLEPTEQIKNVIPQSLQMDVPDQVKLGLSDHAKMMKEHALKDDTLQIFAFTTTDPAHAATFEAATADNGQSRATFKGNPDEVNIDPTVSAGYESKKAERNHQRGVDGTNIVKNEFKTLIGKDREVVIIEVDNSQMPLMEDPNNPNHLIPCSADDIRANRHLCTVNRDVYLAHKDTLPTTGNLQTQIQILKNQAASTTLYVTSSKPGETPQTTSYDSAQINQDQSSLKGNQIMRSPSFTNQAPSSPTLSPKAVTSAIIRGVTGFTGLFHRSRPSTFVTAEDDKTVIAKKTASSKSSGAGSSSASEASSPSSSETGSPRSSGTVSSSSSETGSPRSSGTPSPRPTGRKTS